MDALLALYQLFDSYKTLYPIVIILALLSLWFIRDLVKKVSTKLAAMDALIARITNILDDDRHGDPRIYYDLLKDIRKEIDSVEDSFLSHIPMCIQHFKDIDKILDKSVYEKCNLDQCVGIVKILNVLDKLREDFKNFDRIAESSRENTGATLTKVSQQLDSLKVDVADNTKGTLAILSDSIKGNK